MMPDELWRGPNKVDSECGDTLCSGCLETLLKAWEELWLCPENSHMTLSTLHSLLHTLERNGVILLNQMDGLPPTTGTPMTRTTLPSSINQDAPTKTS